MEKFTNVVLNFWNNTKYSILIFLEDLDEITRRNNKLFEVIFFFL